MKVQQSWSRVCAVALVALGFATLSLGLDVRSGAAQDTSVAIVDFAFQPAAVSVTVGSTVTWTNSGAAPHTVTSDSGAFDSGTLQPGASFSQTFSTPGTYSYFCAIHPNMTGTVTVTEAAAPAAPAAAPTAAAQAAPAPAAEAPAVQSPAAASQVTQMPSTGAGTAPDAPVLLVLLMLAAAVGAASSVALRHR